MVKHSRCKEINVLLVKPSRHYYSLNVASSSVERRGVAADACHTGVDFMPLREILMSGLFSSLEAD